MWYPLSYFILQEGITMEFGSFMLGIVVGLAVLVIVESMDLQMEGGAA